MKNYLIISLPKPLVFFITLALFVIAMIIINNYLAENPIPVSTGNGGYNLTLEDAVEKLYGEMSR